MNGSRASLGKNNLMNKTVSIRSLIFWGLVVLVIVLFIKGCGNTLFHGFFGTKTDTLSVKVDTVWVIEKRDTMYIPVPQKITNTIYKPLYKTDTLEITEVLPTDTAAILARFYQKVFYSDTQKVEYGTIIIGDTVYRNRIASRRLQTEFKLPNVNTTITVEKKRNVVYLGATLVGTPNSYLYAVGGDLSLKSKDDKIYTIGAFSTKGGDVYYQAGFKAPIRFRKRQ